MYRHKFIPILLVAAFLSAPIQIHGQNSQAPMMESVDPGLLDGLNFRLVGPGQGGRSTAVTGVPSQPTTFYMGIAS